MEQVIVPLLAWEVDRKGKMYMLNAQMSMQSDFTFPR